MPENNINQKYSGLTYDEAYAMNIVLEICHFTCLPNEIAGSEIKIL